MGSELWFEPVSTNQADEGEVVIISNDEVQHKGSGTRGDNFQASRSQESSWSRV